MQKLICKVTNDACHSSGSQLTSAVSLPVFILPTALAHISPSSGVGTIDKTAAGITIYPVSTTPYKLTNINNVP
jgi:hypothetical protein